jgi:hypothetical protein
MATRIVSVADVAALYSAIINPNRKRPIAIFSIPSGLENPEFDVAEIEADCKSTVDCYTIPNGDLTYKFSEMLPDRWAVYGGAARGYPLDLDPKSGSSRVPSKLYFTNDEKLRANLARQLTSDLIGYANEAGLFVKPTNGVRQSAKVMQIYGGEVAILMLPNSELVPLRNSLTFPGISLAAILEKGQVVHGEYHAPSKTFTLDQQNLTQAEFVEKYPYGTVTLALVIETTRQSAKVAVHPNLVFEVRKDEITGNPLDVIDEYLEIGEVFPFRVYRDPQGRTRLKCNDIDDDEIVEPAVSLIDGGAPWITEEQGVITVEDELPEEALKFTEAPPSVLDELGEQLQAQEATDALPAATEVEAAPKFPMPGRDGIVRGVTPSKPKETAGDHLAKFTIKTLSEKIAAAKNELTRERDKSRHFAEQLADQKAAFSDLTRKFKAAREDARRFKRESRGDASAVANPWATRNQFASTEDWLRWEVRKYWVENFTVSDRRKFDIEKTFWSFGSRFFDDLNEKNFTDLQIRKVIRGLAELVSGRREETYSPESHALTDGGTSQRMRGKDRAMRLYIEENTASARRLHYWILDSGGVELSNLVLHDTYEIY